MAAKKTPPPMHYLERWLVEQLMFGTGKARRFTQDSPVLPDVWLEYATDPEARDEPMTERDAKRVGKQVGHPPLELLLTPYRDIPAGTVAMKVRERVTREREDAVSMRFHKTAGRPRVIYNQSTVLATLYFEDLVRGVLPLTGWWKRLTKDFNVSRLKDVTAEVAEALKDPEKARPIPTPAGPKRLPPHVLWLIRIVGAVALVHQGKPLPKVFREKKSVNDATVADWKKLVEAVADLLDDVDSSSEEDICVHSVALNRVAGSSLFESRNAIKADAAQQLFSVSCQSIRGAVIDSGIDAKHTAFASTDKPRQGETFASRVRETYDFTQLKMILDADTEELTEHLQRVGRASKAKRENLEKQVRDVNKWLKNGRSVDWGVIAPLLRIDHDENYHAPTDDHGTHVAGIIGGNWTKTADGTELEDKLVGVCPDIQLIDLRILDQDRVGDEFTVMAALQFVRWLNATNDYMAVHGVNMSLSIPHDVANYACGRTPVCDEAERVVNSGVVVVVAAGNKGYRSDTINGKPQQSYNTISITDPGNADLVITVGATHRARPHTYGVSYFSSRGPTGDGRLKPDLVAPGEKITGPLPGDLSGLKDGTSQAAPHVSGAAAMLMARHNELVGRPQRIKQILCSTATDLGRERYFQGAGMLDILRAMQSV